MQMRTFLSIVIGALVALALVAVATALPSLVRGDARGSFVVGCDWSHTLPDDPIRAPFRPGASHSHDFFGNVATDAMSVRSGLLDAATTCRNPKDTAAVWSPTATMNGVRVTPLRERSYYFGRRGHELSDMPADLRMIAGNAVATSVDENPHVFWSCGGTSPEVDHPYDCTPFADAGGTADGVTGHIDFPQCWDGLSTAFSETDPHVAYLEHGSCPSDHPRLIPRLRVRVHFGVQDPCAGLRPCSPDDTPLENLRFTLASGPYYTLHADFWNTWQQGALDDLVSKCLRAHHPCGGA
jgi:hypothetical protein